MITCQNAVLVHFQIECGIFRLEIKLWAKIATAMIIQHVILNSSKHISGPKIGPPPLTHENMNSEVFSEAGEMVSN